MSHRTAHLDHLPDDELDRAERSARTRRLLERADREPEGPQRDELLQSVVRLNMRVAAAVASRYTDRGVPADDLRQTAYEALVKAAQRFRVAEGADFLSFAVPTVRGELLRYFRDRGWMVRPPRPVQEHQQAINGFIEHFALQEGREPTEAEVCDGVGLTRAQHTAALVAFGSFRPTSLDQPAGEDGSGTLGDLAGPVTDDVVEQAPAEARVMLAPVIRRLGVRERRLLHLRYVEQQTQAEIGREFGISQTLVSRELSRVLGRARRQLEDDHQATAGVGR